MTEDSRRR